MKLTITMLSNAMSHHQLPFCEYMESREDIEFRFIATKPIAEERLNMGYEDLNCHGTYILRSYESKKLYEEAKKLVYDSDFVIYGSASYELIKDRLKAKKWTFLYSERIFKNGLKDKQLLKKIVAYFLRFSLVSHKRLGVLCASAYAAKDFSRFGLDKEKMYKWGYFPPNATAKLERLLDEKKENSLIWVGRMIPWKHPELPILVAERLKQRNISFHLAMVGNGEMFDKLQAMITEKGLSSNVIMTGALPKDVVRRRMEESAILLATSDYGEGWGAVINEGMNSACAVVASEAMGAAPFLIKDGENGNLFESENLEDLCRCVIQLLENSDERMTIQRNAFDTICNEWNGERAGEKLVKMFQELASGNVKFRFEDGVCSKADMKV